MIPSAPLGTDAAADRSGLGAASGAAPRWGAAERRFRFELAAHPGSVAQARRLAHARLTGWSVCADTCDSAVLVISELVTNAIVHTASSHVVCELHDHEDIVRMAVLDEGCAPGEPRPSAQRPDDEHGRGLFLVDALCRAWGAQEHGSGLLVWADLPRRSDAAHDTAEPCNDLGWGARPKPDRPADTREDGPAGAGHEGAGRATDELHGKRRIPEQPGRDDDRVRAETLGLGSDGTPEQSPSRAPGRQHLPATAEYPVQQASEQHCHGTSEQLRHGIPEPHRHRSPDRPWHQPLHRAPEQRRTGEWP